MNAAVCDVCGSVLLFMVMGFIFVWLSKIIGTLSSVVALRVTDSDWFDISSDIAEHAG